MCIASVRDCRALADAQPVDVTKAKIPWVMRSQAGKRGERGRDQHGVMLHRLHPPADSSCLGPQEVLPPSRYQEPIPGQASGSHTHSLTDAL